MRPAITSVNTCEPRLDLLGSSGDGSGDGGGDGSGDGGVRAWGGLTRALYSVLFCSFCLLPSTCVAFMKSHDGIVSLGQSRFIYGISYRNVEGGF